MPLPLELTMAIKRRRRISTGGLWVPVVSAADCKPCAGCGEPVCLRCRVHYADCTCPGPTQDDEFEYRTRAGKLEARRK